MPTLTELQATAASLQAALDKARADVSTAQEAVSAQQAAIDAALAVADAVAAQSAHEALAVAQGGLASAQAFVVQVEAAHAPVIQQIQAIDVAARLATARDLVDGDRAALDASVAKIKTAIEDLNAAVSAGFTAQNTLYADDLALASLEAAASESTTVRRVLPRTPVRELGDVIPWLTSLATWKN